MPLNLACTKCGGNIEFPDDVVKEALETGTPITPMHEVCPDAEDAILRHFKIVIQIWEMPGFPGPENELMAQFGSEVSAVNFTEALGGLQKGLNEQWNKIVEQAPIIDQDPPFPPEKASDQEG